MAAHAQNTGSVTNSDIAHIRHEALGSYVSGGSMFLPDKNQVGNLKAREGYMWHSKFGWPDERVKSPIPPADVQVYCNQDAAWQAVRLAMKGMTTLQKLIILDWWFMRQTKAAKCNNDGWRLTVQTSNYITALRRGGLLTTDNWIIK